jgi:hypothetical protein
VRATRSPKMYGALDQGPVVRQHPLSAKRSAAVPPGDDPV